MFLEENTRVNHDTPGLSNDSLYRKNCPQVKKKEETKQINTLPQTLRFYLKDTGMLHNCKPINIKNNINTPHLYIQKTLTNLIQTVINYKPIQ